MNLGHHNVLKSNALEQRNTKGKTKRTGDGCDKEKVLHFQNIWVYFF